MKNYNLSRKKFLSKIIGSWRKVSFELKEKRYLNTSIFFQVLKNVDTSKVYLFSFLDYAKEKRFFEEIKYLCVKSQVTAKKL